MPAYKFARFSKKLQEIKKTLVGGGSGGPCWGAPPWIHHCICNLVLIDMNCSLLGVNYVSFILSMCIKFVPIQFLSSLVRLLFP